LAFANHVQSLEHQYTLDIQHQPDFPTAQPSLLSKVLDSLANVCVSQSQKEVVVTAIRPDIAENSVNIFIASKNYTVPRTTIDYVIGIWDLLKPISAYVGTLHPEYSSSAHIPLSAAETPASLNLLADLKLKSLSSPFQKSRDASLPNWISSGPFHRSS